jgi:hypothetical protein
VKLVSDVTVGTANVDEIDILPPVVDVIFPVKNGLFLGIKFSGRKLATYSWTYLRFAINERFVSLMLWSCADILFESSWFLAR